MKKIWKRLGCAVLAAAMLVGMSVTAMADEDGVDSGATVTPEKPISFTINDVAAGDTVVAYQLLQYVKGTDERYNSMEADSNFKTYIGTKNTDVQNGTKTVEEHLKDLTTAELKALLGQYQNDCAVHKASCSLPTKEYDSKTVSAEGGSLVFDLEPGYYMFLSQTVTTNSKVYQPLAVFVKIDGDNLEVYTNGNSTPLTAPYAVNLKSEKAPVIEKRVNATKGTETKMWRTTAAAGVNDIATFYVALDIPNYSNIAKLDLTLHDTLTNMKYVEGSAKVYSKGPNDVADISGTPTGSFDEDAIIENAIGTVTAGDYNDNHQQTLTIPLNYENITANGTADVKIWVFYQARVKADAAAGNTHSGANSVYLDYGNAELAGDTHTSGTKTTTVYNYAFQLQKMKENGTTPLAGAEFAFYEKSATNEGRKAVKFVAEKETNSDTIAYYRPYVEGETTAEGEAVTTVESIPANFTVRGLDANTYYVKETKTPDGYYAPKNDFVLKLTSEYNDANEHTGLLTTEGEDGTKMTGDTGLVHSQAIDTDTTYQYNVTVVNSTTPTLPTTGGKGTALFTIAGVALMAAAAYLFFFRRKKESK